jgi:hypothetical protein
VGLERRFFVCSRGTPASDFLPLQRLCVYRRVSPKYASARKMMNKKKKEEVAAVVSGVEGWEG